MSVDTYVEDFNRSNELLFGKRYKQLILKATPREAILEQLAEESCELGHAALKLARIQRGENPVADDSQAKAKKNVWAEFVDVLVTASVVDGVFPEEDLFTRYASEKLARWLERLLKAGAFRGEDARDARSILERAKRS